MRVKNHDVSSNSIWIESPPLSIVKWFRMLTDVQTYCAQETIGHSYSLQFSTKLLIVSSSKSVFFCKIEQVAYYFHVPFKNNTNEKEKWSDINKMAKKILDVLMKEMGKSLKAMIFSAFF